MICGKIDIRLGSKAQPSSLYTNQFKIIFTINLVNI